MWTRRVRLQDDAHALQVRKVVLSVAKGLNLKAVWACGKAPGKIEDKMIFQNRGQFGGQVARIGVSGWHVKGKVRQNGPVLENCIAGKQQNLKISCF